MTLQNQVAVYLAILIFELEKAFYRSFTAIFEAHLLPYLIKTSTFLCIYITANSSKTYIHNSHTYLRKFRYPL